MKDIINESIQNSLLHGKSLEEVQRELNEKNIKVDLSTLQRRKENLTDELKKAKSFYNG